MTETYIFDLINGAELFLMQQEGRIKRQVHPKLPISIFNYTAAAQFKNIWTNAERICRGLIIEDGTGKIIARGPSKFMNYGDPKAAEVSMDDEVWVTRKEDGSLGIGWEYKGEFGVATRGSFDSPQAQHATAALTDEDKEGILNERSKGRTIIWEIVYPDNRIVLDYGDRDELIKIGGVRNDSGLISLRPFKLFMSIRKGGNPVMTFKEALELPIPDDQEGYVVDILKDGWIQGHVKLKGEAYKLLHGLLTNTNARRIWMQLAWRACKDLLPNDPKVIAFRLGNDPRDFERIDTTKTIEETFLEKVPDEFYGWVTKQIDSIEDNVYSLTGQAKVLIDKIADVSDKRERWEMVKDHPLCTEILRAKNSEDLSGCTVLAWKLSRPGDETPFKSKEED